MNDQPTVLYGASDVADLFQVQRATVSNWCNRFPDSIPQPDFVTSDGRKYWLSLDGWRQWVAPRRQQIIRKIDQLKAQLSALDGGA